MKKIRSLVAIALTLSLTGCNTMSKTTEKKADMQEETSTVKNGIQTPPYTEENGMLVGEINRPLLEEGEYYKWFAPRYDAYAVDETDANMINNLLEGVDVTIFMGTWCPDSHREVPNFYKIMDAVNATPEVRIFAMTHAKTTPAGLENGKNIQRVPTFIFTKDNEELGRIVEYPVESLEKDMIKILKGEDYKHAYAE